MGWDFHVEMETGGSEPTVIEPSLSSGSYTHNCNGMMRKALQAVGALEGLGEWHMYNLDRKPCAEVSALLGPAIEWWKNNRGAMVDLVPENGWGDEPGAFAFWSGVQSFCAEHSRAVCRLGG